MKGIKKYLVAACVLTLSVVLLAGCSSQASSSAASSSESGSESASSSAASQASQEDLIKELEAIASADQSKSITINIDGTISIDSAKISQALSESSGTSASASAASESAESTSASSSSAAEVPISMVIKADKSQEAFKMFMSVNVMGLPFELYIAGDDVVLVMSGQAYGGTLQDLEALGMSQYGSLESAMSSTGAAASFDQYKDAIKSVTKEEVNGETVYTVELDVSKIETEEVAGSLAQIGATGDVTAMTVTYIVGADGQLSSSTMDMSAPGFAISTTATLSDRDTTVVPDAPEATLGLSDLAGSMGPAIGAASSSDAAKAA